MEYTASMVDLAFDMISITPFYGARTRVGIAHGPAAGAVIGTLRAFYCLYGDTVNTAARMCKSAPAGHVHCTEEFSALVAGAGCQGVCAIDRGVKEIKGKGQMRLIELAYAEKDVHMAAGTRNSVNGSLPDSLTNYGVDYQAVAAQSQAEWLKAPVRRICPPLYKFADDSLEGVHCRVPTTYVRI